MIKDILELVDQCKRIYLREEGEITLVELKHSEIDYLLFKDDFGGVYKLYKKDIKECMACEGILNINI